MDPQSWGRTRGSVTDFHRVGKGGQLENTRLVVLIREIGSPDVICGLSASMRRTDLGVRPRVGEKVMGMSVNNRGGRHHLSVVWVSALLTSYGVATNG